MKSILHVLMSIGAENGTTCFFFVVVTIIILWVYRF